MIAQLPPAVHGVEVSWYLPVTLITNTYLLFVAVLFLATFRPRVQRGLVAYGIWLMSVAVILGTAPILWRYVFATLPATRFSGQWHAALTASSRVVMAAAVTCWLAWQVRERRARRRALPG